MSDGITAVFSMGWLTGVVSATAIMGVVMHERHNKRKHGNNLIRIDLIPCGDGSGSGNNRHVDDIEQEVREQADRLGVKLGG